MSAKVHATTVIEGEVELADGVEIGPYCHIQGRVKIGKGTIIGSHVTLGSRYGHLELGEENQIAPGAVIGGPPQDISYKNESTSLIIGHHNVFREFTTVNLATSKADRKTEIGDHCYFMAYTHIGHDCKIGNNVIIANNTHLAGHVLFDDNVYVGGVCAFNQFVRVGKGSFIAGDSAVNKDILPFSRAQGRYAVSRATNKIGLLRRGFSKEEAQNVHMALRILLFGEGTLEENLQRLQRECTHSENIQYLMDFIKSSKRGIARPVRDPAEAEDGE